MRKVPGCTSERRITLYILRWLMLMLLMLSASLAQAGVSVNIFGSPVDWHGGQVEFLATANGLSHIVSGHVDIYDSSNNVVQQIDFSKHDDTGDPYDHCFWNENWIALATFNANYPPQAQNYRASVTVNYQVWNLGTGGCDDTISTETIYPLQNEFPIIVNGSGDVSPPDITGITITPSQLPGDKGGLVTVSATVSDAASNATGVSDVSFILSNGPFGQPVSVDMQEQGDTNIYTGTVLVPVNDAGQPRAMSITILADDFAGNRATVDAGTVTLTANPVTTSFELLHEFVHTDGEYPTTLLQAADGSFYGTTIGGGANDAGTVFRLSQTGEFSTVFHFGADTTATGRRPRSLIQASDGNLYGVTQSGGTRDYGTIFRLDLSTRPTPTFTKLYDFQGAADGDLPIVLIQGNDGRLYGATSDGGKAGVGETGNGVLFRLDLPSGPVSAIQTIYNFTFASGLTVLRLVQGTGSFLYGITESGGAFDSGTIFKVDPRAAPVPKFSLLYAFPNGYSATMLQSHDGLLYGSRTEGGGSELGSVFKFNPKTKVFTTLHVFTSLEGIYPDSALAEGSDGLLYGATESAGWFDGGSLYRCDPHPTPQPQRDSLSVLKMLDPLQVPPPPPAFATTEYNLSALIQATDGRFYFASSQRGSSGVGAIYRMTFSGIAPVIASLTPNILNAQGPAFSLKVSGHNFLAGATVNWNGLPLPTAFVSAYQLTASVPASAIATPGTASVTVTVPSGTTSSPATFTIGNPRPVLSTVTPASVNAGAPDFTLTAKGSRFVNNSTVQWNGADLATTFVSANTLTAVVPASLIASPGNAAVTIKNPVPGGGNSLNKTFPILLTTLKFTQASLTRNSADNSIKVVVTLMNQGFLDAQITTVSSATLNGEAATNLNQSVGTVPAGGKATATLVFPGTAGTHGQRLMLQIGGTFTGGTFSGNLKVVIP